MCVFANVQVKRAYYYMCTIVYLTIISFSWRATIPLFTLSWHIQYMYKNLNNFRQERDWAQNLYHSTALIEAAKSLVPSNVKGHGKVSYQKP